MSGKSPSRRSWMRSVSSLTRHTRFSGIRFSVNWLMRSPPESSRDPEYQRQHNAQRDASDNRKIKSGVPSLINDVAGQSPKSHRQLRSGEQKSSGRRNHEASDQQALAQLTQRLHRSLPRLPSNVRKFPLAIVPERERINHDSRQRRNQI